MTLDVRTVFLSDCHLGSRASEARVLSQFLKYTRCQRIYLVGDIIDMWRLRQRWYWPGEHNNVIRRLLNHTKHGTDVVLIPGNHDEGARQFFDSDFGGVRVVPFAVHVTADRRRLLVTHGDQFDLVVRHSRLVSMLGAQAYDMLVMANRRYNALRRRLGLPYQSLSKAVKAKVKSACMFVSRFEEALMNEAERRGLDGVVCGHIHQAEVRTDGPVAYYNCGDWIEGCTAIVEHHDGSIQLIDASKA
ncbi:MAG: UDP-2,3-diacylglucosamine diphosphatase, partial [Planctomycetota bacterium]